MTYNRESRLDAKFRNKVSWIATANYCVTRTLLDPTQVKRPCFRIHICMHMPCNLTDAGPCPGRMKNRLRTLHSVSGFCSSLAWNENFLQHVLAFRFQLQVMHFGARFADPRAPRRARRVLLEMTMVNGGTTCICNFCLVAGPHSLIPS